MRSGGNNSSSRSSVHMLSDMTCCGPGSAAVALFMRQSSVSAAPQALDSVPIKGSPELTEIRRSSFGKCREGFLELRGFELPKEMPGLLDHACQ
jgi:hypothetical protein